MEPPDLPPHALAGLVAIAEHGSVSAAARARALSQPTLSRQVQELERRLGTQLIERSNQGARLTPAGEALADAAREVLAAWAALGRSVETRKGEIAGRVRVGTVDSIGIYVLPPVLARFIAAHPRVDVQVVCSNTPHLLNLLLADELDVAVGTMDHPKLSSEVLYSDRLVLAHQPGAKRVPRNLAELAQARVVTFPQGLTVRKLLDGVMSKAGLAFAPVMELANIEAIKAMVRAGLGFGIIPDGCVQGFELETTTVKGLEVSRHIRLLYREQTASLAAKALIEALRSLRRRG